MRIALLCPDLSRNGIVRTYPIAKVLERRHKLQVLGFRSSAEIFAPYRGEFDYDTMPLGPLPGFLARAREMARKVQADAIYAFKPLGSSLWVGLIARYLHKIPLFLDIEDSEIGWYLDIGWKHALAHLAHAERPNGFLWTCVNAVLSRRADEIFVVSRSLQRRFGGTLLVHGANTHFFDPARFPRREALRRTGLAEGRYIVFTGTPHLQKGVGDLLDALARTGNRDTRVLVVGSFIHDQSYCDALLARHGERLMLVGPRPHAEIPFYLAVADVVAVPQRRTRATIAQVPGKVFEAMAMARPILATAVSDLPEILESCGRVVPDSAPEALAEGLDSLLARRGEAEALGAAARARCIERYSWDAMEQTLNERLSRWQP